MLTVRSKLRAAFGTKSLRLILAAMVLTLLLSALSDSSFCIRLESFGSLLRSKAYLTLVSNF